MKNKQHLLKNIQQANEKPVKKDHPHILLYLMFMAVLVVAGFIAIAAISS